MIDPSFSPGFRLSTIDVCVGAVGTLGAIALWTMTWWWGFVIGFVLAHFFLFCNVFRISRSLELAWSGVFVILASLTVVVETPGWPITITASLCATIVVVGVEMRKPSYHGIGWQKINPGLPGWWESHVHESRNKSEAK